MHSSKHKTFVLIHAAWFGAWQWDAVVSHLRAFGHEVIAPDLPGHGIQRSVEGDIGMDDYVAFITDILDELPGPVTLVGHSFNGITISRVAELRPEKVEKLVYVAAFLLPKGVSYFDAVKLVRWSKLLENFYLSPDFRFGMIKAEMIHPAFAHDLPKEDFDKVKSYIVPEPILPFKYELEISEPNWGRVPRFYIECTLDQAIPIGLQRSMYEGMVEKAYSISSSHTPNFSHPLALAEILDSIKL